MHTTASHPLHHGHPRRLPCGLGDRAAPDRAARDASALRGRVLPFVPRLTLLNDPRANPGLTGAFLLASTTARSSPALLGWNCGYAFFSNVSRRHPSDEAMADSMLGALSCISTDNVRRLVCDLPRALPRQRSWHRQWPRLNRHACIRCSCTSLFLVHALHFCSLTVCPTDQAPVIALYADINTAVPVYIAGALTVGAGALALLLPFEPRGKASI